MSYYTIIDGVKYDKEILAQAKRAAADGQVSFKEAQVIWEAAADGPGVTDIEKASLGYVLSKHKFTRKAADFIKHKVASVSGTAQYKVIRGQRYDRQILQAAQDAAASGSIPVTVAKKLIVLAKDGPGITETEERTLQYVLDNFKPTAAAHKKTLDCLASCKKARKSHIDENAPSPVREPEPASPAAASDDEEMHELPILQKQKAEARLESGTIEADPQKEDSQMPIDMQQAVQEQQVEESKTAEEPQEPLAAEVIAEAITLKEVDGNADMVDSEVQQTEDADSERKEKAKAEQEKAAQQKAEQDKEEEEQRRRMIQRAWTKEERHIIELEEKYGQLFDEMDTSGDGNLSHNELKRFVATKDEAARVKLGIGKWQDFLAEVDADGDGQVSRLEFVTYFVRQGNLDPERCFGALFDTIDVSRDGFLQYGEIRDYKWYKNPHIFRILGICNFTEMVTVMDANGDGQIDRDEFIEYMVKRGMDLTWKQATETTASWTKTYGFSGKGTKRKSTDCDHGAQHALDQATLDGHRALCMSEAKQRDLNLSALALDALTTLSKDEALSLIGAVAYGGQYEDVQDKNFFIINDARRQPAKAARQGA